MSDSLQREQAIFDAALELSLADRAAYLDRATHGDGALRDRLSELLKGYEAGTLLENSTAAVSRQTIEASETPAEPGEKIGRYKLLQAIGKAAVASFIWLNRRNPSAEGSRSRSSIHSMAFGSSTLTLIRSPGNNLDWNP